MLKSYLKSFPLIFLSAFIISTSFAASTILTKIGSLDLGGNMYSEWWYTNENPTLYGIAGAGDTVEITIDEVSAEVTADSSGDWSYSPSTLDVGDHVVTVASGGESYSFTLHIGSDLPESFASGTTVSESTGSEVPSTGSNQLMGITVASGAFLMAYLFLRPQRIRQVFESNVLK